MPKSIQIMENKWVVCGAQLYQVQVRLGYLVVHCNLQWWR